MIDGYSTMPFEAQQALAVHLQAKAVSPDGTVIIVDEAIASLLSMLWELGYETRFSCQGGENDNFYNLNPEDDESPEGYIFFECEEMALSFFGVIHDVFPAEEYPLYYIDSRAVIRFFPQAIAMFEYALRNFNGDASYGSKDAKECVRHVSFPKETDAERRLALRAAQLIPSSPA